MTPVYKQWSYCWLITELNSLQLSDTIWRHRSWSTLAQVMACCLTAPSHYLNQCRLIISKVQCNSLRAIWQDITPATNLTEFTVKISYLRFISIIPGTNELSYCRFAQSHPFLISYGADTYFKRIIHMVSNFVKHWVLEYNCKISFDIR